MKKLTLIAIVGFCLTSEAELVLNQGEVLTYEFQSLRLAETSFGDNPAIGVFFVLNQNNPFGGQVRYEMFENSLGESPICSGVANSGDIIMECSGLGAWQDLQGVIRLTGLQGGAHLDRLQFLVQRPGNSEPFHPVFTYRADVLLPVVPEPSTWAFFGVIASWLAWRRFVCMRNKCCATDR